jgi:hypothetical protein
MGSVKAVARCPLAPFTIVVDGGATLHRWRGERLGPAPHCAWEASQAFGSTMAFITNFMVARVLTA